MDLAPVLTAPQGSACPSALQGFFSGVHLPLGSTCNCVLKATNGAFKVVFFQVEAGNQPGFWQLLSQEQWDPSLTELYKPH